MKNLWLEILLLFQNGYFTNQKDFSQQRVVLPVSPSFFQQEASKCVSLRWGEADCAANLLALSPDVHPGWVFLEQISMEIWGKETTSKDWGRHTVAIFCQWNLTICLNYKGYFIVRAREPPALLCLTSCALICRPSNTAEGQDGGVTDSQSPGHHFVFLFIVQTSWKSVTNHMDSHVVL